MKQRKRGIRRMFAGAMAALMVLSAVDVSGWGVMNAKAEDTAVGKNPKYLSMGSTKIIDKWELQDDGVSGNDTAIYQGTNWYYDSTKNQLVLDGASISDNITNMNGDLSIMLSGTNTMKSDMMILSMLTESGIAPTLKINGNNYNGSLSCGKIGIADKGSNNNNLKIIGATLETSQIDCSGSVTIENSHVVANDEDYPDLICGDKINIVDSYVEAKATTERHEDEVIKSNQQINVSESQIVVSRALACTDPVLSDCSFSNSVITKKWKDYETKDNVTKTSVYGKATLKEDLTIASGETIEFESGACITNPEKLTLEDGARLLVNGEEHTHNKDGDITYTWKDDKEHIKNVACKDCPIGYVTKEMEPHSIGENGFCACDNVCQPAVLTTNKYDIDGDSTKDTVYEISNAGQLYWFAGLVNGTLDGVKQNTSANAILTANITANENLLDSLQYDAEGNVSNGSDFISWTPIADCMGDIIGYSGTFDGNNKTVSGLYFNGNSPRIGLFGSSEADSNIKNVGVVDSYFKGNEFVGGVCGRNEGTITNCYNTGNLTAIDPTAAIGGICGINDNGGTIANCYNTGTVTATGSTASVGGVCGYSIAPISNCYNIGTVTATSSGADISSICGFNCGPITNCYYLADTEDENGGKTAAQFASGEVAYLLSQGCSTGEGDNTVTYDGSIWGQTIGTDTYPTLGGAKVYKNATYNGCEGKTGEPVSYEYSNTEKNTYGDHPDADNDGKCDDCGQYIDGIGAKLAGYSLSLTGNIGVNFYMELSNDIVNDESAYMNFILPNGTTSKVYVSGTHEDGSTATTDDTTVKNGVTYYVFTCEVAAKEMTSDIKAQMIGNNGEKKGKVYTYTVKEYADYILSHTSAEESDISKATIQLVKGMLNYGGAAQKYFGYKTDKLASDGLALTEPVFDDTSIINFIKNETNKASIINYSDSDKVTFKSAYLSLNSTTDLCVNVQFAEDVTVQEDMFAIWLDSKEISKDQYEVTKVNEENCYKITLHGIKASQLQKTYVFEVNLSDTEQAVLKYGATSYAYTVMSSACDNINNIESLREVVKALYAYGSCAEAYEYYKNDGNN